MKPAIIAFTILAASTSAFALTMEETDADGDGALSLSEIQSLYPEVTGETFDSADTDADGVISPEELATAQEMGLLPADQS
ncbi:EF-hand domain-containing protein [Psychromarinibacter sp. C21-152]|uniref:EF-hand domain-containing protein n=1 Tax=Psychromarinibacter sediminicola TaxID=3033385 RepID=A0AAE3T9Q3_9RHOB|nr:EF-hand domain-containing protein [Psychromarinibacter sediminicola]MDF0602482.1 EF-hand domain-containing protein [Psychromarinibacter sediminicola]